MKPFHYHQPESLEEACLLLSQHGQEAKILAGGTDLVVKMKQRLLSPKHVINIKKLQDLDFIKKEGNGYAIGSLTRLVDIATHRDLLQDLPILPEAALTIGSSQVRNIATVGGNLCNAAPSADMSPGLLVLEAEAVIAGPEGRRTLPLERFFIGPGEVDLASGEMLVEIRVSIPPKGTRMVYLKHGPRRAMDIAVVGVAVALTLDDNGICQRALIALGAVAPMPVRVVEAEELIKGKKAGEIPYNALAKAVRNTIAPISDVRASADYRNEVCAVLVERALHNLFEK
jgi:carbon-monoxide dehydrogenase medium subunit